MFEKQEINSFWKVLRLIFVTFSLYLMGDVFFRWDGFSYYAPFSEFLPSVALVSILWSIVAVLTTVLIWIPFKAVEWIFSRAGWKMRIEYFLLYTGILILLGFMSWVGKRHIWPVPVSPLIKLIMLLCINFTAIFLVWLFHNKAEGWVNAVQERITPILWIFGLFVIFSVPLVAYHIWGKQTDNIISEKFASPSIEVKNRPNVILVTFDALTSRDMSVHGYHRETTPFLNKWAKSAYLFTRVEAASNYTVPALTSLMTGKRLWSHEVYHSEGFSSKGNIENLTMELKKNGYYNVVYMGNHLSTPKSLGINNSVDFVHQISAFRMESFSILGTVEKFLDEFFLDKIHLHDWIIKRDFILSKLLDLASPKASKRYLPPGNAFYDFIESLDDGNIPEPYFVWFHFYPPHGAYLPPEPYLGMFNSSSEFRSSKSQEGENRTLKDSYSACPEELQPTINILRDRYNESVRYCDKQFENFITLLGKKNRIKNTVVIFSADHGESFQHGYFQHGYQHLFEQVTHIPFIIKEAAQTEGHVINNIVEQIDITATILDLVNIPVPSWMEGRSLVPLMHGKGLPPKRIFSMNLDRNPVGQKITIGTIAVWEGDYKLIHFLKNNKSLLFNLKKDTDELENLFDREPATGKRLLNFLFKNLEQANEKIRKDQ
jgi:arylsulfatase